MVGATGDNDSYISNFCLKIICLVLVLATQVPNIMVLINIRHKVGILMLDPVFGRSELLLLRRVDVSFAVSDFGPSLSSHEFLILFNPTNQSHCIDRDSNNGNYTQKLLKINACQSRLCLVAATIDKREVLERFPHTICC